MNSPECGLIRAYFRTTYAISFSLGNPKEKLPVKRYNNDGSFSFSYKQCFTKIRSMRKKIKLTKWLCKCVTGVARRRRRRKAFFATQLGLKFCENNDNYIVRKTSD